MWEGYQEGSGCDFGWWVGVAGVRVAGGKGACSLVLKKSIYGICFLECM